MITNEEKEDLWVEERSKLLLDWYTTEKLDLSRRPAPADTRGGLLLGCLVYGNNYIERFLSLAIPSIMAPPNARALRRNSRLVIFTDGEGYRTLEEFQRKHEAAGFPTQLLVLPQPVIEKLKGEFVLLGATQNLGVQIAARYGMAYHAFFPDHVYSPNYFPNLLKLGKRYPAIAQSSISASDVPGFREGLEPFRRGDALVIPSVELGDLGWRCLHPQSIGNLMNRGTEFLGYPTSHQCIWQGRDRLYVHCCHMNPVYIHPDLCVSAPLKYFSIIDANLPYIFGDEFYVPTVADDMLFVEASGANKKGSNQRVSLELFSAVCWAHTKFRTIYMPYFERACEVPIKPQAEYFEAADIKERHAQLCRDILHHKELVRGRLRFTDAGTIWQAQQNAQQEVAA